MQVSEQQSEQESDIAPAQKRDGENQSASAQDSKQAQVFLSAQKMEYSLARVALATAALTGIGVFGRAVFQFIPSVEPLTPIAILIGFFFGPIAGLISGASGFYASNFLVWGFQGPWTPFQMAGAGVAGVIGGLFGLGKKSRWKILAATLVGITLYEIIVTGGLAGLISFNLAFMALYMLTSLPFSLVHIGSSVGFSMALYEFKEQIKKMKGGKLIEQEILGLRAVGGGPGQHRNRLVPFFYARKAGGGDSGKRGGGFWFIKRKPESGKNG